MKPNIVELSGALFLLGEHTIEEMNESIAQYYKLPPGDYCSSIDHCLSLIDAVFPVNSITMVRDPSGISAKITVWPFGLGQQEFSKQYVTIDMVYALLTTLVELYEECAPLMLKASLNK